MVLLGMTGELNERACIRGRRLRGGALDARVLTVFFFLVFVFLLRPDVNRSLAFFGIGDLVPDRLWGIALLAISTACIALHFARCRINAFFSLLSVSFMWIAASTAINGGTFDLLWSDWLPLWATVAFVGVFSRSHWFELVRAMYAACMLYLLLNLVSIFLNGNVDFQSQLFLFFSIRTATFKIAVPAIVCSFLLDAERGKWISVASASACSISLFETYVGYCATTTIAVLLLIILRILCGSSLMRTKLNIFTYASTDVLGFLGVVVLRVQNAFGWFIEGVLRRNVALSGRVGVWDAVFALLANGHLVIGYGVSYMWNTIFVNGTNYMHAHNDVLNMLMTGGLILLSLVLAFFVLAALRLYRSRGSIYAALLASGLFCFMVIGLFEVTNCVGSFFLLALSYGIDFSANESDVG